MTVAQLVQRHAGRALGSLGIRIRVTRVAVGEAERLGFITDTDSLLGQAGTVVGGNAYQLSVDWDGDRPGNLMLASEDEIEVL